MIPGREGEDDRSTLAAIDFPLDAADELFAIVLSRSEILFVGAQVVASAEARFQLVQNFSIVIAQVSDQCEQDAFVGKHPAFKYGNLIRFVP
jgi:hypothetical protein